MAEEEGVEVALPLVWLDPDSVEILFVNQLIVQRQRGEFVLTFGQQTPPVLMGTKEEQIEQAKQIPFIPIRVAVRLGTTVERVGEFVRVLQSLLEREGEKTRE